MNITFLNLIKTYIISTKRIDIKWNILIMNHLNIYPTKNEIDVMYLKTGIMKQAPKFIEKIL